MDNETLELLEAIIKIGAAISALIVIWRFLGFIAKAVRDISNDIKETKEHARENYLTGLRLTVMCKDMPIGERIIAGDKYIKEGGNGDVKKYIINELHTKDIQHD